MEHQAGSSHFWTTFKLLPSKSDPSLLEAHFHITLLNQVWVMAGLLILLPSMCQLFQGTIVHGRPCIQDNDNGMQDTDTGMGYLAYSSENNRVMHISALTPDYTHVTSTYTKVFVNMAREAPAMFKHKGVFLIATSGCTGWEPNKLEVFWTRYITLAFLQTPDIMYSVPRLLELPGHTQGVILTMSSSSLQLLGHA